MNETLRSILGLIATCILIGSIIVGVVAVLQWRGAVTWTMQNTEFSVWSSETGGTMISEPYSNNYANVVVNQGITENYWLENDGTVDITVAITELGAVNCSPSWNSLSFNIPMGSARVLATLTLTVLGDGSYTFEFNSA